MEEKEKESSRLICLEDIQSYGQQNDWQLNYRDIESRWLLANEL